MSQPNPLFTQLDFAIGILGRLWVAEMDIC